MNGIRRRGQPDRRINTCRLHAHPGAAGIRTCPATACLLAWQRLRRGNFSPERYQFELGFALSNGASQASEYLQRQPAPFNIQQAAVLAASLGLDQPQRYDNVAVQEPRQIVFENSDSFDYIDHSVFNFPAGRYYYSPDSYPPAELAAKNAQAFLTAAGPLNEPYKTHAG